MKTLVLNAVCTVVLANTTQRRPVTSTFINSTTAKRQYQPQATEASGKWVGYKKSPVEQHSRTGKKLYRLSYTSASDSDRLCVEF